VDERELARIEREPVAGRVEADRGETLPREKAGADQDLDVRERRSVLPDDGRKRLFHSVSRLRNGEHEVTDVFSDSALAGLVVELEARRWIFVIRIAEQVRDRVGADDEVIDVLQRLEERVGLGLAQDPGAADRAGERPDLREQIVGAKDERMLSAVLALRIALPARRIVLDVRRETAHAKRRGLCWKIVGEARERSDTL